MACHDQGPNEQPTKINVNDKSIIIQSTVHQENNLGSIVKNYEGILKGEEPVRPHLTGSSVLELRNSRKGKRSSKDTTSGKGRSTLKLNENPCGSLLAPQVEELEEEKKGEKRTFKSHFFANQAPNLHQTGEIDKAELYENIEGGDDHEVFVGLVSRESHKDFGDYYKRSRFNRTVPRRSAPASVLKKKTELLVEENKQRAAENGDVSVQGVHVIQAAGGISSISMNYQMKRKNTLQQSPLKKSESGSDDAEKSMDDSSLLEYKCAGSKCSGCAMCSDKVSISSSKQSNDKSKKPGQYDLEASSSDSDESKEASRNLNAAISVLKRRDKPQFLNGGAQSSQSIMQKQKKPRSKRIKISERIQSQAVRDWRSSKNQYIPEQGRRNSKSEVEIKRIRYIEEPSGVDDSKELESNMPQASHSIDNHVRPSTKQQLVPGNLQELQSNGDSDGENGSIERDSHKLIMMCIYLGLRHFHMKPILVINFVSDVPRRKKQQKSFEGGRDEDQDNSQSSSAEEESLSSSVAMAQSHSLQGHQQEGRAAGESAGCLIF